MFEDYALCSQEELESKRKILKRLKDNFDLSVMSGGYLDKRLEIVKLEIVIVESEWAIDSKKAGIIPYIIYRMYRIFRVCKGNIILFYNRFLIIYPSFIKMWLMLWDR